MTTRFQTFSTAIRPFRIAILVNEADTDWQSTCLSVMEFLTKVWGGPHAIVVPTNGTTIEPVFWAMLSAHDPDLILTYKKTGEDERRNRPEKFAEILARETKSFIESGASAITAESDIKKHLIRSPLDNFGLSEDLQKQLITRLAPFSFQGKLRHQVVAGGDPYYPLTTTISVLGQVEHAKETMELQSNTQIPKLWLAATLGWSDEDYRNVLRGANVTPVPIDFDDYDVIRWGVQPWQAPKATHFAISQSGLAFGRSTRSNPFQLPTILVLGESLRDFCVYYGLLRLHGRAVWAPDWFFDQSGAYRGRFITLFAEAAELARFEHAENFVAASYSMPASDVENAVKPLRSMYSYCHFSVQELSPSLVCPIVKYPIRSFVAGKNHELSTYQLQGDVLPGPFESPMPGNFTKVDPQQHRWIVEIDFRKHILPRHPGLGELLVSDSNLGEDGARASSAGAAYQCPGGFVLGNDPYFNLVRPTIRVPDAFAAITRIFDSCGYECEISDKGRYESITIEKLGGIEATGRVFRDVQQRALLLKFLDKSSPQKGVHHNGAFLDDRRYLNLLAIVKLLGDEASAISLIDDYISKGVFYRGFIFQCSHCSNVDWFSANEITHNFVCRRCGVSQQYTHKSWKSPAEPSWYYKLDEIVFQAIKHNGFVPILTLDSLRGECRDSFLFCPEIRIRRRGEMKYLMEIDVCCIPDGQLCIGETKSKGTLSTKEVSAASAVEKYRDLAFEIGANRVVFSTTAADWDSASIAAIDNMFGLLPHIHVSKLTSL